MSFLYFYISIAFILYNKNVILFVNIKFLVVHTLASSSFGHVRRALQCSELRLHIKSTVDPKCHP